jgi:hypothetical protein
MGLHCKQLTTQEVIELFYNIYNPEVAGKERLVAASDVSSSFVASEEEKRGGEDEESDKQERVIDNTSMVQAEIERQQQEKRQELDKNSERNIATSPAQPTPDIAPENSVKTDNDHSPLRPFNPFPQTQAPVSNSSIPSQPKPASFGPSQTTTNQSTPINAAPNSVSGLSKEENEQIADPKINQDYGW